MSTAGRLVAVLALVFTAVTLSAGHQALPCWVVWPLPCSSPAPAPAPAPAPEPRPVPPLNMAAA